jgi:hypothetical protein
MKLKQMWFANPMWVDEALSIQKGIGAVMGARSLEPHLCSYCPIHLLLTLILVNLEA